MAEWISVTLRDLCTSVDYGLTARSTEVPTGVRFLRITDIVGDRFSWSSVPFVAADPAAAQKYRLSAGDVVIARTGGTTGESRWLDSIPEPAVFASYLVRLKISESTDPRFVGYLLKSPAFRRYVQGVLGDKSAQPNASASTLVAASLRIPAEKAAQQRIAAVLGALDDKIALNDHIAATSRQLSVALHDAATRESNEVRRVEEIATFLNRGQAPKYTVDSGITVVNQKCVRGGRVGLEPARRAQADRVKADRILRKNDVLVNSTGVGTLGRVGIWSHDITATVDSHVTIVRVDPVLPAIVGAFSVLRAQPEIERMGEGSTGQTELSRGKLASVVVRVPTGDLNRLGAQLSAVEARADAALDESLSLAELRDTLLPQLMSGRLLVRAAEKAVEEAA